MTREEWRRIKDVAAEAWEQPDASRAGFIAAACAHDESLRHDVESLLQSAIAASTMFETPALAMPGGAEALEDATRLQAAAPGTRIGSYRVLRELGHGGMGSVYLAERADGEFEQRVAIKLVAGVPSEPLLRRFRAERRILASLNHPHIAGLLDGGSTSDGLPYVIMEYVDGTPIDVFCERRGLDIRARVELFQRVCDAVHHAHQRQIVHRDIKASNILVTSEGMPKLLDFGIAKIVQQGVGPDSRTILRALTPESASPEQLRGEPVTARSDVYALGALLYRLLAGRSPFNAALLSEAAFLRAVCEEAPEAPGVAVRRNRGGAEVAPIDRDLDLIVLKALRKEPERRYDSAEELSRDLERFLEGQPVIAVPDSRRYRTAKFLIRHRVTVAAAATALVVAAAVALGAFLVTGRGDRSNTPAPAIRSVAVLPFEPLVGNASEDRYLGIALADALITELGALRSGVLRPLNAARFRDGKPVTIGRELRADLVLDGAIQRAGDRLRVNVFLIRVADGSTIWSDRFDTRWTDVFTVQDAIAEQVTRALAVTLTGDDRRSVMRRRTGDVQAYEAYLRGRYFWNTRTADGLQKALTYFQQAIDRDPAYASAYAGLADTYALLGSIANAVLPPVEAGRQAKAAALKALEIDDSLAEAEVSLAFVTYSFDWDWRRGEEHFRRAIALDPDYVTAHYWFSLFLGQLGRTDEALAEAQRAVDLEPLSLVGTYAVGLAHYHARRLELAREYALKALEIAPDFPPARRLLGSTAIAAGRFQEGVAEYRRLLEVAPGNSLFAGWLAHAYGRAGEGVRARTLLRDAEAVSNGRYVSPANIAIGYIGTGDADAAFERLERGYAERSQALTFLKIDPVFDPLRGDPRFDDLLRRVGLAR